MSGKGVLAGIRVVEFAGIGPCPMAAMLLADLGAEVLRIDRMVKVQMGTPKPERYNLLLRSRPSIDLDLKSAEGRAMALTLIEKADILLEGFRPGVMERLGLGPQECFKRNPRLVYGRVTGWGQEGPLSSRAGHDLNYIALSGALDAIGLKDGPPVPPLNLVGDFGGGALYAAMGVLAALISARSSGKGQVVDAAMVDGALSLMTIFYGIHAAGLFSTQRGSNALDGSDPFYAVYECSDGKYLSVAPIETRFREVFVDILGLDLRGGDLVPATPQDKQRVRDLIAARLRTRSRDEWAALFADSDACVAPVLSVAEAPHHPHLVSRGSFTEIDGVLQPVPAPRMPGNDAKPQIARRGDPDEALAAWGVTADMVASLRQAGLLA
jgi:alpha-methylacyl-CoA racemase